MKTVLCFGTFDILHEGHKDFFRQAKKGHDRLVVVIARDETVKIIKHHDPLHSEAVRLEYVKNHPLVDKALLGAKGDKFKIIEDIKPDTVALGYDQDSYTANLKEEMKKRNLDIKIIRLLPYKEDEFKSSILKRKL